MPDQQPRIRAIILAAVVLFTISSAVDAQDCRTFELDPAPTWTISGAWQANGHLVVADVYAKRLISYQPPAPEAGGSVLGGTILDPIALDRGATFAPAILRGLDSGGFLLENGDGLLLRLDDDLDKVWQVEVTGHRGENGASLGSLYTWAPSSDGREIIALGDIEREAGNWETVIATVPLAAPDRITEWQVLSMHDSAFDYYLLGLDLLVGSKADRAPQFLLMDVERHPSLQMVDLRLADGPARQNKSITLGAFEQVSLPRLPDGRQSRQDTIDRFDALADAQIPSGLLSLSDGRLAVLSREGDHWFLELADDGGTARIELPFTSEHLVTIPGPEHWAFLLKGPVELGEAGGMPFRQAVERAVLISTHAIEAVLTTGPGRTVASLCP